MANNDNRNNNITYSSTNNKNSRNVNILLRVLIEYKDYNKYIIIVYLLIVSIFPDIKYLIDSS